MIFTLNIFINLCLILAIYLVSKRRVSVLPIKESKTYFLDNETKGGVTKALLKASVAEKLADRAFSLASSASLGVIALQKTLTVRPRFVSKDQAQRNELAKKKLDELFGNNGGFDWFRPILSDEELDVLDKAEAHLKEYPNKD